MRALKSTFLICLLFVLNCNSALCQKQIKFTVESQEEFNMINSKITEAIKEGRKKIIIDIAPGTYFYREAHIARSNERCDISICIKGRDAVLIAGGKDYKNGDACPHGFGYYSTLVDPKTCKTYTIWDALRHAEKTIEVIDAKSKKCRLYHSQLKDYTKSDCTGAYVQITQWYQSSWYRVDYIKDGWVYFTADNLQKSYLAKNDEFNVNDDYLYAKQFPRFRLCNLPDANRVVCIANGKVKTDLSGVHMCVTSSFIRLDHVKYEEFVIKGLRFVGNGKSAYALIHLNDADFSSCTIKGCTFDALTGNLLTAAESSHITFQGNRVSGLYSTGLNFKNGCEDVRVVKNFFEYGGQCVAFSFIVQAGAKKFYVADNIFKDFSYGAICAGMMRGRQKNYECSGIIENNEIYLTKEYFDHPEKYMSMDAGAIQVRTQSDGTIVRYNYIHDYIGLRSNRGIFCDEGAHNFSICGNVVMNIPNSYSIDARRMEVMNESDSLLNRNNMMMYNIVDNYIRFVGRDFEKNNCRKGRNIILNREGVKVPTCQYGHLEWMEEDVKKEYVGIKNNKVAVKKDTMKELGKLPVYKKLRKHFMVY